MKQPTAMKTMPLPNAFAETLRETLDEWSCSQKDIAKATGILASHLSEMKHGRRRCTAEYDLRLSRYFGMEEGFWMRLQLHYEMQRIKLELGKRLRYGSASCRLKFTISKRNISPTYTCP